MDQTVELRRAYRAHANSAASRGVGFELTFEQWLAVWGEKVHQRGTRVNQLNMCRAGDAGSYAVGNVRIDTARANALERADVQRKKAIQEAWDFDGEDRSECADWLDRRDMGYF